MMISRSVLSCAEKLIKPTSVFSAQKLNLKCKGTQKRQYHKTTQVTQKPLLKPENEEEPITFPQVNFPEYKEFADLDDDTTVFRGMDTDFPCLTRK